MLCQLDTEMVLMVYGMWNGYYYWLLMVMRSGFILVITGSGSVLALVLDVYGFGLECFMT